PLADLLDALRARGASAAAEHGVQFELRAHGSLPDVVHLDLDRTAACVESLVRGGLEHLAGDRVRVEVNLEPKASGTGIGPLRFDVVLVATPLDRDREAEYFTAFPGAPEPSSALLHWPHARQLAQQLGGSVQLDSGGPSGSRLALRLEACIPEGARLVEPGELRRKAA
ncbi:MAG TPA: hypothetical protein VJP77_08280, partial [Planctomycetota bacterium]|nr:hypothetical protein [Planctomycetota bacterium]